MARWIWVGSRTASRVTQHARNTNQNWSRLGNKYRSWSHRKLETTLMPASIHTMALELNYKLRSRCHLKSMGWNLCATPLRHRRWHDMFVRIWMWNPYATWKYKLDSECKVAVHTDVEVELHIETPIWLRKWRCTRIQTWLEILKAEWQMQIT